MILIFVTEKIFEVIQLYYKKVVWRKRNSHNQTQLLNCFPIEHVEIGKGTYGGIKVIDYGKKNVAMLKICNYCSIADDVTFILSGEHHLDTLTTYPFKAKLLNEKESFGYGDIYIADDVWIGYRATILSGVRIGQGAVVAAGAVVNKNVPPYAIVGGIPAKVIKYRFDKEIIDSLLEIDFDSLDLEKIKKNIGLFYEKIDKDNLSVLLNKISDRVKNNE